MPRYDAGIHAAVVKQREAVVRQQFDAAGRLAPAARPDAALVESQQAPVAQKFGGAGIPERCRAAQAAHAEQRGPRAFVEAPDDSAIVGGKQKFRHGRQRDRDATVGLDRQGLGRPADIVWWKPRTMLPITTSHQMHLQQSNFNGAGLLGQTDV